MPRYFLGADDSIPATHGSEWVNDAAALRGAKSASIELSRNHFKCVQVRVYRANGRWVLDPDP